MINLILNAQRRLRSGWWIALFFVVMAAMLLPLLIAAHDWLTGSSFGLEASVPGFVAVVMLTAILARWRGRGA